MLPKNTQLPIPKHSFFGKDATLGPYIIMEFIPNCGSMSARLTVPVDNPDAIHSLNPDIPQKTLEKLWNQVAGYLLQLSRLTFPRIGSLVEVEEGVQSVTGRPISHNMTDMIRLANIPRAVLPPENKTFQTADEWYTALAEMHLAQLLFQHNDAATSADDCRNKYVSRQIFRRLARQGKLSSFGFADDNWSAQSSTRKPAPTCPAPSGTDSFHLWGDDFRAGNILINESDDVVAVIDWEFMYAAPTQFILDPPWWLLIDLAETWPSNVENWFEIYETRLETWLAVMKRAEEDAQEASPFPLPLSTYMRESWDTGRFWLSYGARRSWVFDMAYWRFLDERFFGEREEDVLQSHL